MTFFQLRNTESAGDRFGPDTRSSTPEKCSSGRLGDDGVMTRDFRRGNAMTGGSLSAEQIGRYRKTGVLSVRPKIGRSAPRR